MNSVLSNSALLYQSAFPMPPHNPHRPSTPTDSMLPSSFSHKRDSNHFDASRTKRYKTAPALPPIGLLPTPHQPLVRSRSLLPTPHQPLIRSRSLLPAASTSKPARRTSNSRSPGPTWNDMLIKPTVNLTHPGHPSPLPAHENTTLPSIHMALELARISSTPVRLRPISSSSNPINRAPSSPTRPILPLLVPGTGPCESPFAPNYTYRANINDLQHCPASLELAQSLIQLSRAQDHPGQRSTSPSAIASNPHNIAKQSVAYSSQSALASFTRTHRRSPQSTNQTPTSQFMRPGERAQNESTELPPLRMRTTHETSEAAAGPSAAGLSLPLLEHWSPTVRYAPITPPSAVTEIVQSPHRYKSHHHAGVKRCLSCNLDQSPCWRPSWLIKSGQLCNSCGLRYKKTQARCLNMKCKKVPAKGEWAFMKSKGTIAFDDGNEGYSCLECTSRVLVGENGNS